MSRPMTAVRRWFVVGVVFGAGLAAPAVALPPARGVEAADEAPEVGDGDPAADAIDGGADRALAGDPGRAAKRRPGVKQIEKGKPDDERLEDPEAARRAQWFGAMPGVPMPGFPFPMVPPGFPVVPPGGGGGGAGAVAGNAGGFAFGHGAMAGAAMNGLPAGNGFVFRTWVVGPDGTVIEQPPAEVPPRAGAGKPKVGADRAAKPARKAAGRNDAAKKAKAPARKPAGRAPRDADGE